MRILFVTPYVPSRIRVRPFNLIRSLSTSHDISLISLVCDEYERELVHEVAEYCVSVDLISLPKSRSYRNCLLSLPRLIPLRAAYYASPELAQRINRVIREQSIELVHGELIKVVPSLHASGALKKVPSLFDAVDCISWYLQQQWKSVRNPALKAFVYSELKKMRRYESRALASFNHAVITSPFDREHLLTMGVDEQKITVVPNGVDTEYFEPRDVPREQNTLVFCSKLDYYPNAQAIVRFSREVLPLIWEHRPEVRLSIVGNNPPQPVRDLGADKRITVTGYVPDIRPYLGSATVALAPLQVAAGMQNKVLEAMAMATPIVATPGSCRSLNVQNGVHLMIAEEPYETADAVLRLLEDQPLAQRLGQVGRRLVEENYSWTAATTILSNLYQQLVASQGRGKPTRGAVYTPGEVLSANTGV